MARNITYHMSEAYNLGYDDGYKDGYEEGRMAGGLETRESMIDKACEWLREQTTFEHPDYRHRVPMFDEEDIEDFRKAMGE